MKFFFRAPLCFKGEVPAFVGPVFRSATPATD